LSDVQVLTPGQTYGDDTLGAVGVRSCRRKLARTDRGSPTCVTCNESSWLGLLSFTRRSSHAAAMHTHHSAGASSCTVGQWRSDARQASTGVTCIFSWLGLVHAAFLPRGGKVRTPHSGGILHHGRTVAFCTAKRYQARSAPQYTCHCAIRDGDIARSTHCQQLERLPWSSPSAGNACLHHASGSAVCRQFEQHWDSPRTDSAYLLHGAHTCHWLSWQAWCSPRVGIDCHLRARSRGARCL
jgi:hypothetical protein